MAAPKAPVLDQAGKKARELTLDETVFTGSLKPHLVHEAVRAEQNARRAGTKAAKSRGLVSGGRGKPWRQKGTGRARAGSIRAPQITGGGVAFSPQPRDFRQKVNRKEYRAALRAALAAHVGGGSLGVLTDDVFDQPSTRSAAELLAEWGQRVPTVVVAQPEQEAIAKSFRNIDRVAVVEPGELEVAALVWARSVLVTEAALEAVQRRAA